MPRYARQRSSTQVYHVMLRGIDRMPIFLADYDRTRFLETLDKMKKHGEFEIYAYCLMDNHIHLLLKEVEETIHQVMKRMGVSYAYYFNSKYDRVGHVFQDRFRSEPIEDDRYLLAAVRYIHNNPVKAGIVKRVGDYAWSSYGEYMESDKVSTRVNSNVVLRMFSEDYPSTRSSFEDFSTKTEDEKFLDIEDEDEKADKMAGNVKTIVEELLQGRGYGIADIVKIKNKRTRNEILREIKETGVSLRELSRVLGISKDIIFRA